MFALINVDYFPDSIVYGIYTNNTYIRTHSQATWCTYIPDVAGLSRVALFPRRAGVGARAAVDHCIEAQNTPPPPPPPVAPHSELYIVYTLRPTNRQTTRVSCLRHCHRLCTVSQTASAHDSVQCYTKQIIILFCSVQFVVLINRFFLA